MTPLLSVEELAARVSANCLPIVAATGELDAGKIGRALAEATGIIVAHLPWLLGEDGDLALPLPAQFADALLAICSDLALYRCGDVVSSSEDTRDRYKANIRLLETIATEHRGGLMGPDYQAAEIVEPSETDGIEDRRFFKKGEMI